MTTALGFKDLIDQPLWRMAAPMPSATVPGSCVVYDKRNSIRNVPLNYFLAGATAFFALEPHNNGWMPLGSPALAGTFGAGACAVFHPTQGPRGTIAAGGTTTSFTLTTALPASVAVNQLANDGSGLQGFTIRVISNAAGSAGKTEERRIVANTAGTTPQIVVDSAFSFTPALGDAYEIRSGRVFMLSAGTLAAGAFKFYDVATNSFSGNLSITNLPATLATDSAMVALSEGHIPYNANVSEGFCGLLTASATGASSITAGAQAALTNVKADEYRNFQVRVTQDTTTPTAVGQRRRISTHTAGASGVFTLSTAWTVTPSATAQFVIENDDDKLILFAASGSLSTLCYNITANTWDATTFANGPAACAAGVCVEQAFGIDPGVTRNGRHSHIYRVRGGAVGTVDVFDIAGAATGAWTADIGYGGKSTSLSFSTGTAAAYDPVTNQGRYLYIQRDGAQTHFRFDMLNRVIEPNTYLGYPQGTPIVGSRLHMAFFFDGPTKLPFLFVPRSSGTEQHSIAIQR